MAITDAELEGLMKGIAPVMKEYIEKGVAPLRSRIEELERRPVTLDYQGVWTENKTYTPGQGVTHGGSMWVARVLNTNQRPGNAPSLWQLAVKRGNDGKDASR